MGLHQDSERKRGQDWRDVAKEERTALDHGLDREDEGQGGEDTNISFLSTRKSIRPSWTWTNLVNSFQITATEKSFAL